MTFKESEVGRIPSSWNVMKLSEVGNIVGGGTPKTKVEEYWNGNIAWITPKDLSGFTERYIFSGDRNITDEGLQNSSAKLLPKNSVLFSSRAPIGYVALAGKEMATNQGFKSVVCDDDKAFPLFIYYLLKCKGSLIVNIASGSTFKE
uniref:restriction endonuclease subunit S n=1 Tax=Piscibacillus halophilus TaxID=571933 RepID=UPI001589A6CD